MDEKTLQALQALAQKMGTTAEYLWGVLVKQAPISATVDVIGVLVVFCVLVAVWRKAIFMHEDVNGEAKFLGFAALVFVTILAIFVVWNYADSTIAGFLNPEYWALHELFRSVK